MTRGPSAFDRFIATLTPQLASVSSLNAVEDPHGRRRASLGRRVCGAAIDGVVVGLVLRIIGGLGLRGGVALLTAICITFCYLMVASRAGATLGNLFTGTVVIDQISGNAVSWRRALARAAAVVWLVLSVIGGLVDVLYPAVDVRRQMLHDLAGQSQVVMRRSRPRGV